MRLRSLTLAFAVAISAIGAVNLVASDFEDPVRMTGGGEVVKVEAPGYASPSWADVDGDGDKDLLVGQFNGGKIHVFRNLGGGELDRGEWLEAEGSVAEVPGVW